MLKNSKYWDTFTSNKKASIAEITACQWLLLQGYDVYKNVSAWGAADIVAVNKNEVILVDVCISASNQDIKSACAKTRESEGYNIKFLYVLPDGSCKWREELYPMETRTCPSCGTSYEVKAKKSQKTCDKCRRKPYGP